MGDRGPAGGRVGPQGVDLHGAVPIVGREAGVEGGCHGRLLAILEIAQNLVAWLKWKRCVRSSGSDLVGVGWVWVVEAAALVGLGFVAYSGLRR